MRRRGTAFRAADDEYRVRHRPPDAESGAPLHDLTANGIYPPDVYVRPDWYGYGDADRQASRIIKRVRGKPFARVTMYRAVPCAVREIRRGDWVTPVRNYARQHGKHASDPSQDMCVLVAETTADCLHTDGNSLSEWGYNCPTTPARTVFRPRPRRKR